MRVYLAGPMRGLPEFNFPQFRFATAQLRAAGHDVFNPAERDESVGLDATGMTGKENLEDGHGFSVREALAADLEYITLKAECIVVLPGWQASSGARAETMTAVAIGIPVYSYLEWDAHTNSLALTPPTDVREEIARSIVTAQSLALQEREAPVTVNRRGSQPGRRKRRPTAHDPARRGGGSIEGVQFGRRATDDRRRSDGDDYLDVWPGGIQPDTIAAGRHDSHRPPFDPAEPAETVAAIAKAFNVPVEMLNVHIHDKWVPLPEETLQRFPNAVGPTSLDNAVYVPNATTGGVKGAKVDRFDLLPWDVLTQLAHHYGINCSDHGGKYPPRNWELGYDWSLSHAALGRHLAAWMAGEDIDEESGSLHTVAIMFHAAALTRFYTSHPELDDRG